MLRRLWILGCTLATLALGAWWLAAKHEVAKDGVARALQHISQSATPPGTLYTVSVLGAVLVWIAGSVPESPRPREALRSLGATAFAAACFFWSVREHHHELGDGQALLSDPVHALADGSYYTFLDEAAGMWVPIRIAQVLHARGTESVAALEQGYQMVSVASGVLFAVAAAWFARRAPQRYLLLTLLLLTANSRMFAGYVENYDTCAALLGVTFLIGVNELREESGRRPVVVVAAILSAVAVSFHAVAVWSVFALAYLSLAATRDTWRSRIVTAIVSATVGLATLAAAYALFTQWLTPGIHFVHAQRFGTLEAARKVMAERGLEMHAMVLAQVALPALVMIALSALLAPPRSLRLLGARDVRFAMLWWMGFLVHETCWKSTVGLHRDWDLFGFTWLPAAWLAWRMTTNTLSYEREARTDAGVLVSAGALSVLGGLSWVAAGMR